MNQQETYHTKQKALIEEAVLRQKHDFTIKELFGELSSKDRAIGLATVYRAINRLVRDGRLIKVAEQNGGIKYRITEGCDEKGHCFLKCENCGRVEHADCKIIHKLEKHFSLKHHFIVDNKDITIYGVCEKCEA